MSIDDAIQWIHEKVGHNLSGDTSLDECIEWIRVRADEMDLHILDWHILPCIKETA